MNDKVYDRVNNKSNHTYLSVCLFNTNEIFSVEDWLKQNHREVYDGGQVNGLIMIWKEIKP